MAWRLAGNACSDLRSWRKRSSIVLLDRGGERQRPKQRGEETLSARAGEMGSNCRGEGSCTSSCMLVKKEAVLVKYRERTRASGDLGWRSREGP